MHRFVAHPHVSRRMILVIAFLAAFALPLARPAAQSPGPKKALTADDYTKWKSNNSSISGDGHWVTYVLQTTNVPTDQTKPALHLLNLDTSQDVAVPNATSGTFSSDSKWIAYQV